MKTLAQWLEQNVEWGFVDPADPQYFLVRIGHWSLGGGPGVFSIIALHLETPLCTVAVELGPRKQVGICK